MKNKGEKIAKQSNKTSPVILENHYLKEKCLTEFRDWIIKNDDLKNVRSDDIFLLRFLRAKKYCLPSAQQTFLKYLNLRRNFPEMCTKLDFQEPKLHEVISKGYIFVCPKRDKKGRRIVVTSAKWFNPNLYGSHDQARAHFLTYECLMEDPETQISGIVHIGDFSGVSSSHVTNWNPSEFVKIFKWGEQSLPLRHKEIHLINVPYTLKWIIDFVMSRISVKLKSRVTIYADKTDLLKNIDLQCLPLELGGKIQMKTMIDLWKSELASKRDLILNLDKILLLNDKGIKHQNSCSNKAKYNNVNYFTQIDSVQGSFKKLEFD